MFSDHLTVHPEIEEARATSRPVVALESTIITHGMPYPRNIETALAVEEAVRDRGAVPATIAVLDGRIRVGLERSDLERLGQLGAAGEKISRRDLPFVVGAGACGGTTVAATMLVAAQVGIEVFATGGIGGVHRDAAATFDVSADLEELGRTPVTVVCAGVKSILDIAATLEYLETKSVPVIGYRTTTMPAFFARDSGVELDRRVESPVEVARIIDLRRSLGLAEGMVVANPVPEEHAADRATIDAAIERALADAERTGVRGRSVTPFLLARVDELTSSSSLMANVALVCNNAALAAEIAAALAGDD